LDEKIQNIEKYNEIEELFLKEVRNGEKKCKLSYVLDEFNFSFIKSLFL